MNSRRKFLQNITASVIAVPFLSKNEYLESFKEKKNKEISYKLTDNNSGDSIMGID